MKLPGYEYPKSSFLGIQKDAALIMGKIISNQNILKLLKYNSRDWLHRPNVTSEDIKEMFETKQISSVPKIKIDNAEKTYLRFVYGSIIPNGNNPQYRDNAFSIDIICHYDSWELGDFDLRPYRLAGEIDSILNNCRLSGIGTLNFISCNPYIYDEEFAGVTLTYLAIRGQEDKQWPLDEQ